MLIVKIEEITHSELMDVAHMASLGNMHLASTKSTNSMKSNRSNVNSPKINGRELMTIKLVLMLVLLLMLVLADHMVRFLPSP